MQPVISIFPLLKKHNKLYRVVLCCREDCDKQLLVDASKQLQISSILSAAEASGWKCDKHGYALCPDHKNDKRRPDLSPAQRRAAYCRIMFEKEENRLRARQREKDYLNKLDTSKAWKKGVRKVETITVRQPTPEQRWQIVNQLETLYNRDAKHYIGSNNDQTIATKLNYPRIWIKEIRDQFYGPEQNEVFDLANVELTTYIEKCRQLETDALEIGARAEELEREGYRIKAKLGLPTLPIRDETRIVSPGPVEFVTATPVVKKIHRLSDLEKEDLYNRIRQIIIERNEPMLAVDIHKQLVASGYEFAAINRAAEMQAINRITRLYNFERVGKGPKNLRYWPSDVVR